MYSVKGPSLPLAKDYVADQGLLAVCLSSLTYILYRIVSRVISYHDHKTPDGHCPYIGFQTDGLIHTLEEAYIDGVSITHGSPIQHIWSFIAFHDEDQTGCHGCPCHTQFTGTHVPFIGDNFFCDSGTTLQGFKFHFANPVWDGQGLIDAVALKIPVLSLVNIL